MDVGKCEISSVPVVAHSLSVLCVVPSVVIIDKQIRTNVQASLQGPVKFWDGPPLSF